MSSYIDLAAVGKVIACALVLGAGLPAVFALGLRALAVPERSATPQSPAGGEEFQLNRNPGMLTVAGICFLVVVLAVVYGIYLIANGGK